MSEKINPLVVDLSRERWLPVVGYEGFYEVSDFGRVRSLGRRFHPGRILRPNKLKWGYLQVKLHGTKRQTLLVHRLVAAAFIGPLPPGKEVDHKDGVTTNNALVNLRYVSKSENLRAAVERAGPGNWRGRGEKHPMARLRPEEVLEIRRLFLEGMSQAALGKMFAVTKYAIYRIVHRKNWKHV